MSTLDFRWISRNSMMRVWWTAHPWKADWEEGKEGLHLSSLLAGLWVSESPTRIFWCYKSSRWGMYCISYHIRDTQMVMNSHTLSPKLHFLTLEKKNALCAVLLAMDISQQPFMNIIVIRHNLLMNIQWALYSNQMESSVEMINSDHTFPPTIQHTE